MNYYDILDVSQDSDIDTIKKAYRRLAVKWHPDKNPNNIEEATKKFKDISEAYQILSDSEKKKNYDMYGKTPNHFRSPEDLFTQLFSNFDPIVSDFLTNTLTKITKSFTKDKNKSVWDVVNEINKEELIEGGSTVVKKMLMKNFVKNSKKKQNDSNTYKLTLHIDEIDYENEIGMDINFSREYTHIELELTNDDISKTYIIDTEYIEHTITFNENKYLFLLVDKFPPGYERYNTQNLVLEYKLDIQYKDTGFRLYYPYTKNEYLDCNICFICNSNIVKIPQKGLLKGIDNYGDLFIIFIFTENGIDNVKEESIMLNYKTYYSIDPKLLIDNI
tara:strand:+ start:6519 stop:7514 length:996 start_codon:yes stop_codon:yes gene_type:complete